MESRGLGAFGRLTPLSRDAAVQPRGEDAVFGIARVRQRGQTLHPLRVDVEAPKRFRNGAAHGVNPPTSKWEVARDAGKVHSVEPSAFEVDEAAKAIVRSGVLARDLTDRIGDVVTVVGHLVTVKETATAKGERMCFGCFVDLEGAWLDTVHFPGVARDFPFRGRGVYAVRGTVSESFGCLNVDAQRMERLATLPDPRYAENGVMPAGIDSGLSSRRRQPPKSASAPGFRGAVSPVPAN